MNIFNTCNSKQIKLLTNLSKKNIIKLPDNLNSIKIDVPPEHLDFDISSNASMVLSKINQKPPMEIGNILISYFKENFTEVDKIEIIKPGFINIKFDNKFWYKFIKDVLKFKHDYGIDLNETKKKYLVEFVSANPTGPLHVGHSRGAIIGDVISNLLIFNKHNVNKEYYVNDYGNQILNFSKSVYLRIREILFKESFLDNIENIYPGNYVIDIAKIIIDKKKYDFKNFEEIYDNFSRDCVDQALSIIKKNLSQLDITHDQFVSEYSLVKNNEVEKTFNILKEKKLIYSGKVSAHEREDKINSNDQLLFKSTDFGDDKDRVLKKSDSSWTYFASDAAYHNYKLSRNYDTLVNILGADHTGYIKRISSIVEALSGDKNKLINKVSQLVKLIKDNKPFKMSKRQGDYITVDDLINEVGKDAARFIMLNRSSDVELEFNFEKIKEKSKDNPLYYIQYCYARICSVLRIVNKNPSDINIDLSKEFNFNLSKNKIQILRKISQWPNCISVSSSKLEPHRIPTYLYELSSLFHSYWNMGKQDESLRFIKKNNEIDLENLVFLLIISQVIKTGMGIIGASTPEKM